MNDQTLLKLSRWFFGASLLIPVIVLFGWYARYPSITHFLSNRGAMKVTTALGILILSLASFSATFPFRYSKIITRVLSIVVATFSILSISEYLFHIDLGIDQYFRYEMPAPDSLWPPGRPSIVTLYNFLLVSLSLLGFTSQSRRAQKLAHGFLLMAWILAFQSIISHIEHVEALYNLAIFTQLGPNTATALFLMGLGLIISRPHQGIMRIVASPTEAGRVGRGLLVFAVVLPPTIDLVQNLGANAGWWNAELGAILRVVLQIVFFSWVAFRTGSSLLEYQAKEKLYQQSLENAVRSRDEFLSIASHELRTPITGMKLQAALMRRHLSANDQSATNISRMTELIEQTDGGLNRMTRLIEDMLDISRIQNGKLSLKLEEVDFTKVAKETLARFSHELETAGITVHFTTSKPAIVKLDRYRIEQVLTNLITNAIRYAPRAPLQVSTETRDGKVMLTFKDHGPGIAEENLELIFDQFERLVSANDVSGLGLGLFIARQIIENHGGSLHAESVLNEGTSFVIHLPANDLRNLEPAT